MNKTCPLEYNVPGCDNMLKNIIDIAIPILTVFFGTLSAYFRVHDQLRRRSIKYIAEAEELYKDSTKAGGQKFSWVVDNLYELIPPPLKVIITKKCIEIIVQSSFDAIEDYAKMQLDMAVEKYLKHFSDGKSGDFIDFIRNDAE
jgi:hypothetical protein